MRWITKKEIAELGPVFSLALIGMLVLGVALVYERSAVEPYLWSACLAGLLLGLFQAFLDMRAESDAFLRHRALPTRAVRVARTIGGFATIVACVLAPWVFLLLIPGIHGYDVWGVRFLPDQVGDLEFVHTGIALGFAATMWSLARLGGSVRRLWLRPVTALLLPGLGLLALLGGGQTSDVSLALVLPVFATLGVVFPAREVSALGALRLCAPAALLGLAVLVVASLDAGRWTRMSLHYMLEGAYPQTIVTDAGEVRFYRAKRDGAQIHMTEWDAARENVLFDGPRLFENLFVTARSAGMPLRHESSAERLLDAGWIWNVSSGRWRAPWSVLEVGAPFLSSGLGGHARLEYSDGWLAVAILDDTSTDGRRDVGRIGPDGFVTGEPIADGERFSDQTFLVDVPDHASTDDGARFVFVDPVRRAVTYITRVESATPADVAFDVVDRPLPRDTKGTISGLDGVRNPIFLQWYVAQSRDLLTLLVGEELLVLEDGRSQAAWTRMSLPREESLWYMHLPVLPEAPVIATALAPYRDIEAHLRIRARPIGAAETITTDFVLEPREPLEYGAAACLGAVTILRPPVLNVASFIADPAQSWEELDSRWWLDGIIAGGMGLPWLLASLVVGALSALRNRRQALLRCVDRSEVHAWTAVGLALGPIGVAWMEMLVRKSAIRTAPGGRELAVHVPTDWPAPKKTGREVLV